MKIYLILLALISPLLHADDMLIQEVDRLRSSLSLNDRARPTLTLRLADLLFEKANELQRDQKNAESIRNKAIALYESVPVSGIQQVKVYFQLARLYADSGNSKKAMELWQKIFSQPDLPDLRKEAALRLAEDHSLSFELADSYYRKAIELCTSGDSCYFVHYKRAWLLHSEHRDDEAVQSMKLSLFDSKNQVREEALRDLILFSSSLPLEKTVPFFEDLAIRINRPALLTDLYRAYFSAGNKASAIQILALINSRNPTTKQSIVLLEEYYGSRNWHEFRQTLEWLEKNAQPTNLTSEEEKILKRLTIQLEGEKATQPQVIDDFKRIVILYVNSFPKSESINHYKYILANAYYDSKQFDEALSEFKYFAESPQASDYRTQSRHLILDIYNQKKDYSKLMSLSSVWLKEDQEIKSIYEQALFEQASKTENISVFKNFCLEKKFIPKSCENWKVLTVKVANEYELKGMFFESAETRDSYKGLFDTPIEKLKTALLYELADSPVERDRILKSIANFVSSSPENLGPIWEQGVLEKVIKLDQEHRKIHFYGRNSKSLFQKRLLAFKKFVKTSENFLPLTAEVLRKSHEDFANEILLSPIPKDIPEDVLSQIESSLKQLADPFLQKAKEYDLWVKSNFIEQEFAKKELKLLKTNALKKLKENPSDRTLLETLRELYQKAGQRRLALYFEGRLKQ